MHGSGDICKSSVVLPRKECLNALDTCHASSRGILCKPTSTIPGVVGCQMFSGFLSRSG